MEKTEIKKNLEAFTNAENDLAIKEAAHLTQVFNALYSVEIEDFENLEVEEIEEKSIQNPKNDALNLEILELISAFKKKRKEQKEKAENEIKTNALKKKQILLEFEELIQTKENIGFLINGIKKIREDWSLVGNVSTEDHNKLQSSFSKLNDEFNYNITIYKELKENDLKVNYSLKNKIIHELKELENETKIKTLDAKLKKLQNEWDNIGPTFKEHWEGLKTNYWKIIHAHYDRIKAFYKEQKENLDENLTSKNNLINQVKELTSNLPNEHDGWENLSLKLKEIQDKWKSIGPVPKKVNNEIWKSFRSQYDTFYNAKKEFYNNRNTIQKEFAAQKKALIAKAEAITTKDFKQGVAEIKKIQTEWKKIGHAGKYAEQKLWHNFRANCDKFFDKKNEEVKAKETEANENLKAKTIIIDKLKAIDTTNENSNSEFKKLILDYTNSGKSTANKTSKVNEDYKKIVLEIHEKLAGSNAELEDLMVHFKKIQIQSSADPEKTLQFEREKIRKRINTLIKEVLNYENNLGFFNTSSSNNPLLKNVTNNIEKGKDEIEKLKKELKKLSF
jgi:hypothetical protein